MRRFAILLCVALPVSISRAQSSPGIVTPPAKSQVFDIDKLPFKNFGVAIGGVSCQKLTTDPAGTYTVCLSVRSIKSAYGGNDRRRGVLLGKYDIRQRTFTPTTQANLLNDTGYHHYNLHVEPGAGLVAVCDRLDAASDQPLGVWLSVRASDTAVFPAANKVAGVPSTTASGYDAAIGRLGGVLHLFYRATIGGQQGIWIGALDLTVPAQPKVAGQPRLVVRNDPAKWLEATSPTPLVGPDGDVEGLWYAQTTHNVSSVMALAEDLDPATPPLVTLTGQSYKQNGGIAGGTLLCADNGFVVYTALTEATGSWLIGDDEARGGIANFLAGATGGTATKPVVTALLLSGGAAPAFPLQGIHGAVGIALSPLVLLGAAVHDGGELATWSLEVPNDPGLAGKRFAVQGLSIGTTQPAVYAFTNSAWLTIR